MMARSDLKRRRKVSLGRYLTGDVSADAQRAYEQLQAAFAEPLVRTGNSIGGGRYRAAAAQAQHADVKVRQEARSIIGWSIPKLDINPILSP